MIKFEVELSENQLNEMVHILRLFMKQQYDETTRNPDGPVLPSDDRIEKFNAVAATFVQLQYRNGHEETTKNLQLAPLSVCPFHTVRTSS